MDKVKIIHDAIGHTLTVWLGDPSQEHLCEETADEVTLMKDKDGKIIGFELLHYTPASRNPNLLVETVAIT